MRDSGRKKKKKGRKILFIFLIIVVLGIGIAVYSRTKKPVAVTPMVETTHAARGDLQEKISISGSVAGEETVTIYLPAGGTVNEIMTRTGDEVKAGTLLASYDLEKLEKELHQAELQNEKAQIAYDNSISSSSKDNVKLKEANTNIPVLEQQVKGYEESIKALQKELNDYNTKSSNDTTVYSYQLKKQQALYQADLAKLTPGTEEYEKVAKNLETIVDQIEQLSLEQALVTKSDKQKELEKKIEEEQEALAEHQDYLARMKSQKASSEGGVLDSYSRRQLEIDKELGEISYQDLLEEAQLARDGIKAPFQGVITGISIAEGSQVSAGMTFATLERTDKMKVMASAGKYAMGKLKTEQQVDVEIGSKTFSGKVSHVDRIATASGMNNTSVVAFEVELLEKDESIFPGMEAKMTVYTAKAENAMILPTQAVNANKDGDFVYVVVNGKIEKKSITLGIVSNGKAEITEGITESDEVVLKYSGSLEEGMEVLTTPAQTN